MVAEPFAGTVVDAGGGRVDIVVDRDTATYPSAGEKVTVISAGTLAGGRASRFVYEVLSGKSITELRTRGLFARAQDAYEAAQAERDEIRTYHAGFWDELGYQWVKTKSAWAGDTRWGNRRHGPYQGPLENPPEDVWLVFSRDQTAPHYGVEQVVVRHREVAGG